MDEPVTLLPLLTCAACGNRIEEGVEYACLDATVLVCKECDEEEQEYEGMYN